MEKNTNNYLIIVPSLLGERVVAKTVHLDIAIHVELLIAQLLVVEHGVEQIVVEGEAAARAITLLLALCLGRGSHRSTAG